MPGRLIVKNVSTNDDVFSKMKGFLKLEFINVHKKNKNWHKYQLHKNKICTKNKWIKA